MDVRKLAREHATVKKQKPGHSEAQLDCLQRNLDRLLACPRQSPEFAQYLYEFTDGEHYALLTAIAANFDDFTVKVLEWAKGEGKAFNESRGTQLPQETTNHTIPNDPDIMSANTPAQRADVMAVDAAPETSGTQPVPPECDPQSPAEAGAASSKIAAQSGPQSPQKRQRHPGGRKLKAPKLSTREPTVQPQEEPAQNAVVPSDIVLPPAASGINVMPGDSPPGLPSPAEEKGVQADHPNKSLDSDMSPEEHQHLARLEGFIVFGRKADFRQCDALLQIHDLRLYRDKFRTFDRYCKVQWDISRAQGNRMVKCAEKLNILSPIGDIPQPTYESQIRPLTSLPPDQVIAAWRRAVELADGKPVTAALVKQAVAELPGRAKAQALPKKVLRVPLELMQKHVGQITAAITLLKGGTVSTPAVESLEQARANLQALLDAAGTPPAVKAASENNQPAHPTI